MRRKLIALVLIGALLVPYLVTGCSARRASHTRPMEYIEDGEWFDTEVYLDAPGDEYLTTVFNPYWSPIVSASPEEVIILEEFSSYYEDSDVIRAISRYNFGSDGELQLTGSVDLLNDDIYPISEDSDFGTSIGCNITGYFVINDKPYLLLNNHGYIWGNDTEVYFQEIDLDNNSLGARYSNDDITKIFDNQQAWIETSWTEDDGISILVRSNLGSDAYSTVYKIVRFNSCFELEEEIILDDLYEQYGNLTRAFKLDNKLLLICHNFDAGNYNSYYFDLNSRQFDEIKDMPSAFYQWIYDWNSFNNKVYRADSLGAYEFDIETLSIKQILDYNNCNVNRFDANQFEPAYIDDNQIIMSASIGGYIVCRFTKADSNPNAGKGIIRIASVNDFISYQVADAIYEFNKTSDTAFIVLDNRYNIDQYNEYDWSQNDGYAYGDAEYLTNKEEAKRIVSNQLRIDIMAGCGPDIILNANSINEINNSNCLLDIKSLLLEDGTINPEDYVKLIFDGDEALYQLPLSVAPVGIAWKEKCEVDEASLLRGMSYEQYLKLVSDDYNGRDPMSFVYNQTQYFVSLFNYSYDTFVHDGVIDINNEEFRAMAEFANTRPISKYGSESYYNYYDSHPTAVNWEAADSIMSFGIDLNGYDFYALPSFGGSTGVKLNCIESICIASSCPLQDESVEFVKVIMNEYSNRITVEGIRNEELYTMDMTNRNVEEGIAKKWYDSSLYCSEDVIEEYIDVLQNATGFYTYDSDIAIIMYEEIQPYFAGDKTLDEIIPIIEDRCQTVLNEKK